MPNLANLPAADLQAGAHNWSGPGYIDGLQMQWVSATAVTVSSGRAYIPSLGYYLDAPNAIALTGLVLTASTWYHLYLYNNAGTPAVECVTTAPAAPYSGTACAKTGDTSRRYIGSLLTDGIGNIYPFSMASTSITYLSGATASLPFRVLAFSSATVSTSVSLLGIVPVTALCVHLKVSNQSASGNVLIQSAVGANAITTVPATISGFIYVVPLVMPCPSQSVAFTNGASSGSTSIDVYGYDFGR